MSEQQKPIWTVDSLLAFISSGRRIYPMPMKWKDLYEMLPDQKPRGGGWEPPLPLILGGWSSTDWQKRERLAEHIRYAAEHDVLQQVGDFLYSLRDEDWYR